MLRRQVNPKIVAAAILLVLLGVQVWYWWLLVKPPPGAGGGGGGGAPQMQPVDVEIGLEAARVETLVGGRPGLRDGPAGVALLDGPNALAAGADGRLFIADSRNHRVRVWLPSNQIMTVAGGGAPGPGGGGRVDGPALTARFTYPSGVAVAADGELFLADTGNHRICGLRDGVVRTLAGGTAGDRDGTGPAAQFRLPAALSLDDGGALLVLDAGNGALRSVSRSGEVRTLRRLVGSARQNPLALLAAADSAGLSLLHNASPRPVYSAARDGQGPYRTTAFRVGDPAGIARLEGGLRVLADPKNHVIGGLRRDGTHLLLAGRISAFGPSIGWEDSDGRRAAFAVPCAVAAAGPTSVFVADFGNHAIRRVTLPEWAALDQEPPVRRFRPRTRWDERGRDGFGR